MGPSSADTSTGAEGTGVSLRDGCLESWSLPACRAPCTEITTPLSCSAPISHCRSSSTSFFIGGEGFPGHHHPLWVVGTQEPGRRGLAGARRLGLRRSLHL